jgi:L-seryl-tRNA(Ser) seleniumtransferase
VLAAVLDDEPIIARSVADGSSLVLFSGDKLLAGPQAGIIAGRTELIERCRRHPLARITRIDKLQLAALEETLRAHLRGTATTELPALALLRTDIASLIARAERIAAAFESGDVATTVKLEVRVTEAYVGGGSAPGRTLPGAALACSGVDPELLAAHLRAHHLPVIARIEDGVVLLDLRSVPAEDDALLSGALRAAILATTNTDTPQPPG